MAQAGEAGEVAQLEQVLLRLAMIDNDFKLETTLDRMLPLILNMMSSSYAGTKKKAMEVLSHINKRTTSSDVRFPVAALTAQFLDPAVSGMQKNFTLIYLKKAFARANEEERTASASLLFSGIAGQLPMHQHLVYSIAVAALPLMSLPTTAGASPSPEAMEEAARGFPWMFHAPDRNLILDFMLLTLLSNYASYSSKATSVPRGMTEAQRKQLAAGYVPSSAVELDRIKCAILELCGCVPILVSATQIIRHAVVGNCDPSRLVAQQADTLMRRSSGDFDLENKEAILALYNLYLGTPADDKTVAPANRQLHASSSVKHGIMAFLAKSKLATSCFPHTIKVIFDSSYGAESSRRSKESAVHFIRWVFTHAPESQLRVISPLIFSGLRKLIKEQAGGSDEATGMKVLACNAMVPLCKRLPSLFSSNFAVILDMFDDLLVEKASVQASIQESLCLLAPTLRDCDLSAEIKDQLFVRLQKCVVSDEPVPRLIAVKFATFAFAFDELRARHVCAMAAGDSRSELRVQAAEGLRPFLIDGTHVAADPLGSYPPFGTSVAFFHAEVMKKQKAVKTKEAPYATEVYAAVLAFLQRSLQYNLASAEVPLLLDAQDGSGEAKAAEQYRELLEIAMNTTGQDVDGVASKALLHLLQHCASSAKQYVGRLRWLKQFVHQGQASTRENMAKVIGVLVAHLESDKVVDMINEFLGLLSADRATGTTSASQHELHGNLSVLGIVIGNAMLLKKAPESLVETSVLCLARFLLHKSLTVAVGAVAAIGSIARFCKLPLPLGEAIDPSLAVPLNEPQEPIVTRLAILGKLRRFLRTSSQELVERTVQTLADIRLGDREPAVLEQVIKGLTSLSNSKREDVLFSVGESLSLVAAGWASKLAPPLLLCSDEVPEEEEMDEPMREIVKIVVRDHLFSGDNAKQMAGSVWLLCLVKHSGMHRVLQANLTSIQQAFTHMLASTNDVVQEIGSRGMVLAYENCDGASRRSLVGSLMGTLQKGAKGFKATEDTQLFPEGMMGKTPDGGNISTYRELSSLATDMGKPDLMYKFMSMASHHALWSSRKGAAFAASALANSEAREQMQELLPALVPRLYRSSYDPSAGVAQAMTQLLRTLAGSNVVEDHWDGIVKELLEGMQSRQWRVREASCHAMTDALRGRSFVQLSNHLKGIYHNVFRVMDGIKESVVKAAIVTGKALAQVTVRMCDPHQTPANEVSKALGIALPFLLQKGLVNDSEQVQQYTLDTVLKLSKASGAMLGPYVPELMGTFLENLSNVEPKALTYYAQKTEELGVTAEQMESIRASVSSSSPMSETLEICVERVDSTNVKEVAKKLIHLIRHGVGMPTQVGTAKALARLSTQATAAFRKYAAKLMKPATGHLCSTSSAIRKAYGNALAAMASIVPATHTATLLAHLRDLYCNKGELLHRQATVMTLQALAHSATVKLKDNNVDCVPLAFLGTCDTVDKKVAEAFKDLWAEVGVGGAARLYMEEITALIVECLASQSWPLRQQGALALASLAGKVDDAIWPRYEQLRECALTQFQTRRLWTGKEAVLFALAALLAACKPKLLLDEAKCETDVTETVTVLLGEVARKNVEYQRKALTALGQVLVEFGSTVDVYMQVRDVIEPIIEANADVLTPAATSERQAKGEMDKEYREASKEKARRRLVQAECYGILGKAWPSNSATQEAAVVSFLDTLLPPLSVAVWNVKLEMLKSLSSFTGRSSMAADSPVLTQERVTRLLTELSTCAHDPKYEVVREAAFSCIKTLVVRLQEADRLAEHKSQVEDITKGFSGEYGTHLLLKELKDLLEK